MMIFIHKKIGKLDTEFKEQFNFTNEVKKLK